MLLLLEVVERFTHLGTQISKDTSCEAEISRRITITRDCVRTENPAAPYLAFEHHGSDQGTAAERMCSQSSSTELRHGHSPLTSSRSWMHFASGVWDDFCDFPTYATLTNVEVLRLTRQTQLSTTLRDRCLRFLVISRGRTAEWIIHVLFDPLFLDCHATGNDLPVDHDELGFVRLNIGLVPAWQRA